MKYTFSIILLLLTVSVLVQAQTQEPPLEWIDPDTGHQVVRLSREPGSESLYFHQNAYTTEGDKLIMTSPTGVFTFNIKTREIEKVIEGRVNVVVVGRKTRQVYYTKDGTIFATNLDTRATKQIVKLPFRGGVSSLNADETLLLGARNENQPPAASGGAQGQRPPDSGQDWQTQQIMGPDGKPLTFAERKEVMMNNRLNQRIPMVMYTVNTQTGEVKNILRSTDWLGHLQFSPTDPNFIMFCHEGPWHRVDRLWTIRTDGSELKKLHTRTMNMENVSRDGTVFGGDGGDSEMVAHAKNGKWIYLFRPEMIPDVAGIKNPNPDDLIKTGFFRSERLVNMSKHNYELEPNMSFTPDGKWIVFRSNMFGSTHVYAVEVKKSK